VINNDGNVGIGTTNPQSKLQVSGGIKIVGNNDVLRLEDASASSFYEGIVFYNSSGARTGGIRSHNNNAANDTFANDLQIWSDEGDVWFSHGNVGIGIGTAIAQAKLHVDGGNVLVTNGAFIDDGTTLTAPDYVFEQDYELRPLAELGEFISSEKHLPGVPSSEDIKENGLNLSEFSMALLEKTEENVLYTLQQEERLAEIEESLRLAASSRPSLLACGQPLFWLMFIGVAGAGVGFGLGLAKLPGYRQRRTGPSTR